MPAFQIIADTGFNLGRDKGHNKSMAEAIAVFTKGEGLDTAPVVPEKGLGETNLIPDNAVPFSDETLCIEYTWRKGEFLAPGNRSTVASYVLGKLKDYAIGLGWLQA